MTSLEWIAQELHRLREIVVEHEPDWDENEVRASMVLLAGRMMRVEAVARGAPIPPGPDASSL